jgi:crotonobetainyl-CoA:carnitine CoA-transferase CaiB-like acyl-CoA transferase
MRRDRICGQGFVFGKILAALGVEVVKVERPGRNPVRVISPFLHNTPHPEKSLYWYAFSTDKRSITLNLEVRQEQDVFRKLVEKADFVIRSFVSCYVDSLGFGYEALREINPRIIITSIIPFGEKSPW